MVVCMSLSEARICRRKKCIKVLFILTSRVYSLIQAQCAVLLTAVQAHSKQTHACTSLCTSISQRQPPLRRYFSTLTSNHSSTKPSKDGPPCERCWQSHGFAQQLLLLWTMTTSYNNIYIKEVPHHKANYAVLRSVDPFHHQIMDSTKTSQNSLCSVTWFHSGRRNIWEHLLTPISMTSARFHLLNAWLIL